MQKRPHFGLLQFLPMEAILIGKGRRCVVSAPNQLLRDAEAISYGFMAARTSNALRQALDNQHISADDKEVLENARLFLQDISDGASFTASGAFRHGANPSRSLAALDVAFGPLDALRHLVNQHADVSAFFEELANAVSKVKTTGSTEGVEAPLQGAREFFEALNVWLSAELNTRKPLVGSRQDAFM